MLTGRGGRREQRIRERAYFLSQQAGFPSGRDEEFWIRASELEPRWPRKLRFWLADQKDALSAIQAAATVIALCIGGWWTYRLFDPVAQLVPSLYVTQSGEMKNLGSGLILLHLNFILQNTGKDTAYLTCAHIIISQVMPVEPKQAEDLNKDIWKQLSVPQLTETFWPGIKQVIVDDLGTENFYVEVGTKASYTKDFVFPDSVAPGATERLRTIRTYANFQMATSSSRECRRKSDGGIDGPGWISVMLYDLPTSGAVGK